MGVWQWVTANRSFRVFIRCLRYSVCMGVIFYFCSHHADGGVAPLVQAHVAHNCKRLTVELMHYIIEARSLRKVRVGSRGPGSQCVPTYNFTTRYAMT